MTKDELEVEWLEIQWALDQRAFGDDTDAHRRARERQLEIERELEEGA